MKIGIDFDIKQICRSFIPLVFDALQFPIGLTKLALACTNIIFSTLKGNSRLCIVLSVIQTSRRHTHRSTRGKEVHEAVVKAGSKSCVDRHFKESPVDTDRHIYCYSYSRMMKDAHACLSK